jgi:hypothetical protein
MQRTAIVLSLALAVAVSPRNARCEPVAADTTAAAPAPAAMDHAAMHHGMDMGDDMAGTDMHEHTMSGVYGPYPMTREASGTSWQPDDARHQGVHLMRGAWTLMLHGYVDAVYDDQGGSRGDQQFQSDNMGMAMAHRSLGPGTLGLRTMLSLEPATIGRDSYPLLLQTGETADGVTPLIDRQHPHDLFMELAASWSVAWGDRSVFVYGGLPGEPALGPPAFMHRFSGANIPAAPITHHWLDSSHVTFGVLTAGVVAGRAKLEASAFRGREPDERRWDIEAPKLDSHSFRLSINPSEHWALQASYGRLVSPEQLEPDVDQDRLTASAIVDGGWRDAGHWEGMLAWGQDRNRPGHTTNAWTAEAALALDEKHTVFARAENVEKDELFVAPNPLAGRVFTVGEVTAGYRYDMIRREHAALGIGAAGTLWHIPSDLVPTYGTHPAGLLVFVRAGVR